MLIDVYVFIFPHRAAFGLNVKYVTKDAHSMFITL